MITGLSIINDSEVNVFLLSEFFTVKRACPSERRRRGRSWSGSLQDLDSVAVFGIINCGLYCGVFFGDQQVCSLCRRRKRKEGCKDCRPPALIVIRVSFWRFFDLRRLWAFVQPVIPDAKVVFRALCLAF